MQDDFEYELWKYIDQQIDQDISLKEKLKKKNWTYQTAKKEVSEFKKNYDMLLQRWHINKENVAVLCCDLIKMVKAFPDQPDLQHLYFCTLTDAGLLNPVGNDFFSEQQEIENYIIQDEKVQILKAFMQKQTENIQKLNRFRKHVKKRTRVKNINCLTEVNALNNLTIENEFLYPASGSQIYNENLQSLLIDLNSDDLLKTIKPYLIFAVLSRKHGMMMGREHFIPNLKTAFQYQEYQIYKDNGKNFNNYCSYLELYLNLMQFYQEDNNIDTEFCDFCFANLSPLNEFYFQNCCQDFKIPLALWQKVRELKSIHFPKLFPYEIYHNYNINTFQVHHAEIYEIWEKTVNQQTADQQLKTFCEAPSIAECISALPYAEKYPKFAELFIYQVIDFILDNQMLALAKEMIAI